MTERTKGTSAMFALVCSLALANCVSTEPNNSVRASSQEERIEVPDAPNALPAWQPGMLDIHHINTGRGNSAFIIMPDGTTMLVDAGALRDDWDKNYKPLKLNPAFPDNSRRPGEWIADYIAQFAPPGMKGLDYALISHFHADHFGRVYAASPKSSKGNWKLAGLTDVAERWPISTMIDRDYPDFNFPVSYRQTKDPSVSNYFRFVDGNVAAGTMKAQALKVGRDDQILLKHKPDIYSQFSIRNIAGSGKVWTGKGDNAEQVLSPAEITEENGKFNENPLSNVIKISYGNFDYVTGGDLTGVSEPDQPDWFDMESKIAPVIGEADIATLNHHGNRDATNASWLRTLRPRILIQQTWVSDHPGGEVVARITSRKIWPDDRDIFATFIQEETKIAIGPWLTKNYQSTEGHIVIRVQPGGVSYDVFILNDRSTRREVTAHFGSYKSR